MKLVLLFCFIFLFMNPYLIFAQKDSTNQAVEWELHWENCTAKNNDGNFTIKFPQEPLYDQTLQTLKLLHQGIKYEVAFEHNKRHKDLHAAKHLLNSKTNNFVKKLNKFHKVAIDTTRELKMLGLNAQETWMQYNDELGKTKFVIYRVLITHEYLYELVLRSDETYVKEDIRHNFLDSFHLLDNQIIRTNWHTHVSIRGHFKVDLPSSVEINTSKNYQIITSNIDEISCQLYYPKEPKEYKEEADKVLDKAIEKLENELKKKIDISLLKSERLQILGYPAKEARFSAQVSGIPIKIIFRALLTPKELFQFQIVSPYDYVNANTAHRFFDSFELLDE